MYSVRFFYTVHNGGDGSYSAQFHADADTAQLACDLEEEGGEAVGDNYPNEVELVFDAKGRLKNPSETTEELMGELDSDDELLRARVEKMPDIQNRKNSKSLNGALFFVIKNNNDGSASVGFYEDQEAALISCTLEEKYGAFSDNGPHLKKLSFNDRGVLMNPDVSKQYLQKELAEKRGEPAPDPSPVPAKKAAKKKAPGRRR